MKRAFLPFLLLVFTAVCAGAEDSRPNFIFFLTDDISWNDLGCYGNDFVETPNLDQMAAEGMRFTQAYLVISSCSPSRNSLITGRYPHNHGAPELHTNLPEDQFPFPQALQEAGYHTVLSGKNHMRPDAQSLGFDVVSGGGGPGGEADWVQLLQDRPRDKPFFCWFASHDAHRSWQISDEAPVYDPEEIEAPPYLYDGPKTRADLAEYYHEVSRTDTWLGKLREELQRQGIQDNTYIIYMADNGRPFPRCKTRLYDSGIKTPFLVACPGKVPAAVTDSFVSSIDVAPTILDLAGVDIAPAIQGVSFAEVLKNPETVTRHYVFAEHNWHVFQAHERMVRWGDWLYIRNAFPERRNLCKEGDPSFPAGEELWEMEEQNKLNADQRDIFLQPRPAEELYRVSEDPYQLNNLAENADRTAELEKARSLLNDWTEQTGDTVPENITNDRQDPYGNRNPDFARGDMPGAGRNATEIHHPGPVKAE